MSTTYYAVIFTSLQTQETKGYSQMADTMESLAKNQPGFIDMEHARSDLGITISYWKTLADIQNWKDQLDHQVAQRLGREKWYEWYKVRICKVEREYEFKRS